MRLEVDRTTVLDLAFRPKEAALHFDYVIPCYVMISGRPFPLDMDSIPCDHLIPEPLFEENRRPQISPELIRIQTGVFDVLGGSSDYAHQLSKEVVFTEDVRSLIDRYPELRNLTIFFPYGGISYDGQHREDILVNLAGLNLIDTGKTTWEQIVEFRKDRVAMKRIRRLRLFFSEASEGKDRDSIQDDLAQRVEDYKEVVREWGFNTKVCAISKFLSSSRLNATAGESLISLLLGSDWMKDIMLAGDIASEIDGKVSIGLTIHRRVLEELRRDHPEVHVIDRPVQG